MQCHIDLRQPGRAGPPPPRLLRTARTEPAHLSPNAGRALPGCSAQICPTTRLLISGPFTAAAEWPKPLRGTEYLKETSP